MPGVCMCASAQPLHAAVDQHRARVSLAVMCTSTQQQAVARCLHMRWHAQVVIMTTPLAAFFKCQRQDGYMWLFAIGVGSGSLLVSLLTKLLTRCARMRPILILATRQQHAACVC